ncbi:MAG: lipid-A-disaccharide synthase [Myxococcaceae bacterium]
MQLLVVAGEASGDQHAAAVLRAVSAAVPDLKCFGMGGEQLRAAGQEQLFGAEEISVMGISEVLPKLPRILKIFGALTAAAEKRRPDAALLVDVPDFNLRLARRLRRLGIPVIYFISPMLWAWRSGRVRAIARDVSKMLCILPFEEAFYREHGVSARYVGNPLLDHLPQPGPAASFRSKLGLDPHRPTVALLPGSRASEIARILPVLAESAAKLQALRPTLQCVVPLAPLVSDEEVRQVFRAHRVEPILVRGQAADAVGASDAAVVASGTAALEAGLMQRPLVVVYRVSPMTYWVGRAMLRVSHVSLVNLLAERAVVPELLQDDMTPERIVDEIQRVWDAGPARDAQLAGMREVRERLGEPGATARAAAEVLEVLRASPRA